MLKRGKEGRRKINILYGLRVLLCLLIGASKCTVPSDRQDHQYYMNSLCHPTNNRLLQKIMKNEAGSSINLGIIPGNHARNDANNEGRIDHHIQKPCMLKEKIHIYIHTQLTGNVERLCIYIYIYIYDHQHWYGLS
jgi:hypothetical protein